MNKFVALPTYDFAFKNCDYRMLAILLHKFEYTQTSKNEPFKMLMKWKYKEHKKQMIKEYGKTDRTWNRNFKKMIEHGFIEEYTDHYKIYNKNKENNADYKLIPYNIIKSFIEDDITNTEIANYVLIYYKCHNYKLETCFLTHIPLIYFAETMGTNISNSFRDYIGDRIEGEYCEGAGVLTKLEENGYIKIKTKKEKSPKGNFNINTYHFIPILE